MKKLILILTVCLAIVSMAIIGIFWLSRNNLADEKIPIKYSIDDIEKMLLLSPEDTFEFEKISTENLDDFNYLLNIIDRKAGEGNYYIYSIYETDIPETNKIGGYGIKIILKDYADEFMADQEDSLSPYKIFFHCSTDNGSGREMYDYYDSFLAARDYEKDFKEAMEKEFADYQVNIQYNYLDYIYLKREYSGSWEKELDQLNFSMNGVIVFVPYGADADAVAEDFQNKGILKDFYIKSFSVLVVKENVDMKSIEKKANQYSDCVYDEFGYQVDNSGKLE